MEVLLFTVLQKLVQFPAPKSYWTTVQIPMLKISMGILRSTQLVPSICQIWPACSTTGKLDPAASKIAGFVRICLNNCGNRSDAAVPKLTRLEEIGKESSKKLRRLKSESRSSATST